MLINFIFNIILTIANFVLSPFMSLITSLFPDLSQVILSITNFFSVAITYVSTILHWFFFDKSMWILIFDYYIIKYSIFLLTSAVRFTINIYDKLKP